MLSDRRHHFLGRWSSVVRVLPFGETRHEISCTTTLFRSSHERLGRTCQCRKIRHCSREEHLRSVTACLPPVIKLTVRPACRPELWTSNRIGSITSIRHGAYRGSASPSTSALTDRTRLFTTHRTKTGNAHSPLAVPARWKWLIEC